MLDRIVYRATPDPTQRVLAYRAGALDMLELVEYEVLSQLAEEELVFGDNMGIQLLLVNTLRPPLDRLLLPYRPGRRRPHGEARERGDQRDR